MLRQFHYEEWYSTVKKLNVDMFVGRRHAFCRCRDTTSNRIMSTPYIIRQMSTCICRCRGPTSNRTMSTSKKNVDRMYIVSTYVDGKLETSTFILYVDIRKKRVEKNDSNQRASHIGIPHIKSRRWAGSKWGVMNNLEEIESIWINTLSTLWSTSS
jgi:hypothetical protein